MSLNQHLQSGVPTTPVLNASDLAVYQVVVEHGVSTEEFEWVVGVIKRVRAGEQPSLVVDRPIDQMRATLILIVATELACFKYEYWRPAAYAVVREHPTL